MNNLTKTENNIAKNQGTFPSDYSDSDYQQLIEQIASIHGDRFFLNAVKLLASITQTRYAFITEITDNPAKTVKTLAFWDTDKIADNFEYALASTPCNEVIAGDLVYVCEDVQSQYPQDLDLVDLNASGFVGAPIFSSDNTVLGHIVAIDEKPFTADETWIKSIIRIFSARTGPELERYYSDNLLQAMASDLNLTSGKKYFKKLSKKISDILDVDFVVIGKLNETAKASTIETLAVCNKDQNLELFSYELNGSPCQKVINHKNTAYASNIQQQFPEFKLLQTLNAEGYVGIPLLNSDKEPIGIINVISQTPLKKIDNITSVLSVFAVNAAYELERNSREEELVKYQAIISTTDDFMILVDTEYRYQAANNAYLRYFNTNLESIIGRHASELHGEEFFNEQIKPALDECLTGKPIHLEFWKNAPDGNRHFISSNQIPHYDSNGTIAGVVITAKNMTVQKQLQQLNETQVSVLKAVATGNSQQNILKTICEEIELLLDGNVLASIFLAHKDNNRLTLTATSRLSSYETNAFKHKFTKKNKLTKHVQTTEKPFIYSEKINKSSIWHSHLDLMKKHHFNHSHSYPLHDKNQTLLGYFNLSYQDKTELDQFEQTVMELASYLASIAIERKSEEQALKKSEQQFKALYDGTPSMFCTIDQSCIIKSINRFGANKLGYTVDDLLGKNITQMTHSDDRVIIESNVDNCFASPEKVHNWELRNVHKNGEPIYVKITARVVIEDSEEHLFIVCEDISETQKLSQKLSYQATHDSLTGLINRREFERRLENIIKRCKNDSTQHAMCYLDLDQFKIINDSCGHMAGDVLLKDISEVLSMKVRKRDTLARLGGDEFGILMEHCTIKQAERTADTLRKTVEDFRFVWKENKFSVGASIGLVAINSKTGPLAEILSDVDAACYAAKDAGRNRIHVYSKTDKDFHRQRGEMKWVNEINKALDNGQFYLYTQKIIDVKTSKTSGYFSEILLRLRDKNDNTVPPGAFLPAAERYNLSTKIDEWVVDTSLKWISKKGKLLKRYQHFSINLSGYSLEEPDFLEFVLRCLEEYQIPENIICFEITETAAIANLSKAIHFMNRLGEHGCLFALDDFGSGVSSFGYLKNLPVDYVKIDGSFVRDILDDPISYAMVRSINEIAHEMGKKTIAEFVEKKAIIEKLREIGVDYAQGYSVGRPRRITLD